MMSGHGQIGRQGRSLTQHYPMSDNISGLPPPPTLPLKVDIICVSPLNKLLNVRYCAGFSMCFDFRTYQNC